MRRLRERRLRKMEPLGRATEVKLFGDGYEVAKVTQLDVVIHI